MGFGSTPCRIEVFLRMLIADQATTCIANFSLSFREDCNELKSALCSLQEFPTFHFSLQLQQSFSLLVFQLKHPPFSSPAVEQFSENHLNGVSEKIVLTMVLCSPFHLCLIFSFWIRIWYLGCRKHCFWSSL